MTTALPLQRNLLSDGPRGLSPVDSVAKSVLTNIVVLVNVVLVSIVLVIILGPRVRTS